MSRECEYCGRRLRTGVKYCYTCRSLSRMPKKKPDYSIAVMVIGTGFIFFLISLFSNDEVVDILGTIGGIISIPAILILIINLIIKSKK